MNKKNVLPKILLAGLNFLSAVTIAVFLSFLHPALYGLLLAAVFSLLVGALLINRQKHPFLFRLFILASLLLFVYVAGRSFLYHTGFLQKFESLDSLRETIRSFGSWGPVIFFLLVLLQVVILPLPAGLFDIGGALLFGSLPSFLLSSSASIIGSMINFILGRFFGKKILHWLAGQEKTEKYTALLSERGKSYFIIMMLLPGFPDDLLCMAAGLTDMTYWHFFLIAALTRPPMIAYYSFIGDDRLLRFDLKGILIRLALTVGLILIGLLIHIVYTRLSKRKKEKIE